MTVAKPFMTFIEDFEKEAEDFLSHYGYAEAITVPMPVPIQEIIRKRMALSIIRTETLSPDATVQGIIAFTKGIVQIYDWESKSYIGYMLESPAIMADAGIASDADLNELLAHEAFHWYKHRFYFLYRAAHGEGTEFAFRCNRKYSIDKNGTAWSDEERMEWQARKIAPMILLPRKALLEKLRQGFRLASFDEVLQHSIDENEIEEVAAFFRVGTHVVRKRLQAMGCRLGVFLYKNHEGIPEYKKTTTKTSHPITPFISLQEAFELYRTNVRFRSYLNTGLFTHRFDVIETVIEHRSVGFPDHLVFEECLYPVNNHKTKTSDAVMFHRDQIYEKRKIFRDTPQNVEALDVVSGYAKQFQNIHSRKAANCKTANEVFWRYMRAAKWNTGIFQDKTLLSPMDYTRIQKPEHTFKLPAYVAMAVGLQLSVTEFQDAIKHSGLCLIEGDKKHDAYSFILSVMQGKDIDECNEFLESVGIEPLGTHTREDYGNCFSKER